MAIVSTKRERKKALKALMVRLLTSACLGTAIVGSFYLYDFLTTHERLAVAEVEFRGLRRLETEDMQRLAADIRGQNILLLPIESYSARFHNHPRVLSAEFKRILPNRVVCTIEEREPVALVYTNKFLEVDRGGMIMTADDLTDMLDLPIITGLDNAAVREGKQCSDSRLGSALRILSLCKKYGDSFAHDISELRLDPSGVSIVSLKEGLVLRVGDSQFENRLKKFFVMRQAISNRGDSAKLVDLRFDDQIVLRSGI